MRKTLSTQLHAHGQGLTVFLCQHKPARARQEASGGRILAGIHGHAAGSEKIEAGASGQRAIGGGGRRGQLAGRNHSFAQLGRPT